MNAWSLSFLLLTVTTSATPGAINLTVAAMSSAHGWRSSLPLIAGSRVSAALMLAALAAGLAAPSAAHPGLRTALLVCGTLYLVFLALVIATGPTAACPHPSRTRTFLQGAVIQASNPKAWLSLSAIALFLPLGAGWEEVALLTLTYTVISSSAVTLWSIAGARVATGAEDSRRARLLRFLLAALTLAVIPMLWR
jgi:threonine/homoserine/homoserine lactone efflux protein